MYDITFHQIETFLTVAKCTNLSKAAELLSYSQPALSKTLRKLEESVGVSLFTRSNQGMELTSDGEYLFSIIEPLFKNINQSIRHVQLKAQMPAKVLNIMAPSLFDYSADFDAIRNIIRRYENKHPDVLVRERLCDFSELREALYLGKADFVITEDFAIRDIQDIVVRPISMINVSLLISSKHRLAQSDTLDFSALSGETLFTLSTFNEEVDTELQLGICNQLGIKPKKIEFVPNFPTLLHVVNLGKGVSLSSKLKNIVPDSTLRCYPLKGMKTPNVVVAWRNGKQSRPANHFINMLPGSNTSSLHS
jgi:DNA-binding transcriptional LysR family regulator